MFIAILLVPVTNMLGGDQAAWIKLAVILAVISFVSLLVLYKVTKENVTMQAAETCGEKADAEKMCIRDSQKFFHTGLEAVVRQWIRGGCEEPAEEITDLLCRIFGM